MCFGLIGSTNSREEVVLMLEGHWGRYVPVHRKLNQINKYLGQITYF